MVNVTERMHRVAGPGLCVAASCLSSSKGFGESGREALGSTESVGSAHRGARVAPGSAGWGRFASPWTGLSSAASRREGAALCLLVALLPSVAWPELWWL